MVIIRVAVLFKYHYHMSWSIGLFQQYSGNYEPSWIKFKYGAWYLDPKTWQKRDTDQPLMDPKALKDQEMSEAKKKSKELVSEVDILCQLHKKHCANCIKNIIEIKIQFFF